MQFEWTSFYSEFATKLLEFKDNRAELIADIQSAYSAINMKLPKLESEDSIIDIDPFTVFGLFNKGITNANRIAILESFATVFNIKSKVPDNFDGIPVLNNLKATYYGFKDDRQADDIDNLYVVGRCLSADFYAQAALRIIPSCFSMGEGVAKYILKNI